MKLYLLRHGIAQDGHPGMPDEARELTPEGRKKLKDLLKVAREAAVEPSLILSSPLMRAVQTAELAAGELKYGGEIARTRSLIPEADPRETWEEIRVHRDEPAVLLSSHNPLCASLAGYLLATPQLWIDYKKGAMMRIDLDTFGVQPHGVLRWYLTPGLVA